MSVTVKRKSLWKCLGGYVRPYNCFLNQDWFWPVAFYIISRKHPCSKSFVIAQNFGFYFTLQSVFNKTFAFLPHHSLTPKSGRFLLVNSDKNGHKDLHSQPSRPSITLMEGQHPSKRRVAIFVSNVTLIWLRSRTFTWKHLIHLLQGTNMTKSCRVVFNCMGSR